MDCSRRPRLRVDTLREIATNKVCTLVGRSEINIPLKRFSGISDVNAHDRHARVPAWSRESHRQRSHRQGGGLMQRRFTPYEGPVWGLGGTGPILRKNWARCPEMCKLGPWRSGPRIWDSSCSRSLQLATRSPATMIPHPPHLNRARSRRTPIQSNPLPQPQRPHRRPPASLHFNPKLQSFRSL